MYRIVENEREKGVEYINQLSEILRNCMIGNVKLVYLKIIRQPAKILLLAIEENHIRTKCPITLSQLIILVIILCI